MKTLQALYDLSVHMLTSLEKVPDDIEEREHVIALIQTFIEKREQLVQQIQGPYSEDEMQLGKQLVKLDEQMNHKMNDLLQQIQIDMKKIKAKKKLNRSYINPYGNIKTTDGMYLDSKQ
ncbi:flagellar protein FliT [Pseudogracilibacillus sp. ICA-222130]|uniref:flagellar protein FliT n=1 Tax=Pseudogracilibacillus sp. ICA-222130 TaxID=3134655 RepID=UPI0030BB0E8A